MKTKTSKNDLNKVDADKHVKEIREKTLQEFWKIVCEADSDWESFCKCPTGATWNNWYSKKEEELSLAEKLRSMGVDVDELLR